jgi:phosphatidate cytidylyltransferase
MRRILTAVILIPAIVCLVLLGPPWLLAAVTLAIAELGIWEFFRLAEAKLHRVARVPGYAGAAVIMIVSLFANRSVYPLGIAILFVMIAMTWAMYARQDFRIFFSGTVSATLIGITYVAVPLSLLIWICMRPGGRLLTLLGLVLVWTGDTMAFFVGRAFGTHKLALRLSPGKTWEGSAASTVSALLVAVLFARFVWRGIGYGEAVILAAILNVAAQIGDLAESALKRSAGVKDSSQLVPGHGGVLDRIDALLFAAPVLCYYWFWKSL